MSDEPQWMKDINNAVRTGEQEDMARALESLDNLNKEAAVGKKSCPICGYDKEGFFSRIFYSCKAPSCSYRGVPVCSDCHNRIRAEKEQSGCKVSSTKCPICTIGEIVMA